MECVKAINNSKLNNFIIIKKSIGNILEKNKKKHNKKFFVKMNSSLDVVSWISCYTPRKMMKKVPKMEAFEEEWVNSENH